MLHACRLKVDYQGILIGCGQLDKIDVISVLQTKSLVFLGGNAFQVAVQPVGLFKELQDS
jgi:hypothetical protein